MIYARALQSEYGNDPRFRGLMIDLGLYMRLFGINPIKNF